MGERATPDPKKTIEAVAVELEDRAGMMTHDSLAKGRAILEGCATDLRSALAALAASDNRTSGEEQPGAGDYDLSPDLVRALQEAPLGRLEHEEALLKMIAKSRFASRPFDARLCDVDGIVREGVMHHGTDYPCTGSAHYEGLEIRCTNPLHEASLPGPVVGGAWPVPERVMEVLVEHWHESDTGMELHDWLGMTWEQYAEYVQSGEATAALHSRPSEGETSPEGTTAAPERGVGGAGTSPPAPSGEDRPTFKPITEDVAVRFDGVTDSGVPGAGDREALERVAQAIHIETTRFEMWEDATETRRKECRAAAKAAADLLHLAALAARPVPPPTDREDSGRAP